MASPSLQGLQGLHLHACNVSDLLTGGAGSVVSGSSSRRAGSIYRQLPTLGERPLMPVSGSALDAGNGMCGLPTEQLTPQQLGAMGEYRSRRGPTYSTGKSAHAGSYIAT